MGLVFFLEICAGAFTDQVGGLFCEVCCLSGIRVGDAADVVGAEDLRIDHSFEVM